MSIQLGDSGYSYDLVNGISKGPKIGDATGNRALFALHKRSWRNEIIFGILAGAALLLFALPGWMTTAGACVIVAALLYWIWWSGGPAGKYLEYDPVLGTELKTDDRAELMIGYGKLQMPFIRQENLLRDLIVSSKSIPAEMSDATLSWKCVELDDAKVVFELNVGDVNGVVKFFQSNVRDFAAVFGDQDRYEFVKIRPKVWRLTFYAMAQNTSAGVSWT